MAQFNSLGERLILVLIFLFISTFQVACSLLAPRPTEPAQRAVEVRDVPLQARASLETAPRKRVLVLPFLDADERRSLEVANQARALFIRQLTMNDGYVVIQLSEFPKDLKSYLKNGEYDLDGIAKIAGGMGLAAVIEGRITDVKAKRLGDSVGLVRQIRARVEASVGLRVAAARNGKLIFDETRSASGESSTRRIAERAGDEKELEDDVGLLQEVVEQTVRQLAPRVAQAIEKLNWEGRVALIKGERVYVNAGRLSGLQIGDILRVSDEGEDVFDPESGALIGRVPGRLKGTIEVVSYFGKDGSIAVIHSGGGFRENDLVELY